MNNLTEADKEILTPMVAKLVSDGFDVAVIMQLLEVSASMGAYNALHELMKGKAQ